MSNEILWWKRLLDNCGKSIIHLGETTYKGVSERKRKYMDACIGRLLPKFEKKRDAHIGRLYGI